MEITAGPLTDFCTSITLSAKDSTGVWKWSAGLGLFMRTEKWFHGRPVYVNSNGKYLHVTRDNNKGDSYWCVGTNIGMMDYIRSTGAPLRAEESRHWVYTYSSRDRGISIKCNE